MMKAPVQRHLDPLTVPEIPTDFKNISRPGVSLVVSLVIFFAFIVQFKHNLNSRPRLQKFLAIFDRPMFLLYDWLFYMCV